ncbi:MAG: YggS family pyridoxal phosphate-dependent enzyme [Acidimicrobiia bacterium]|nr:YggS family pyridoxal phosphate-dependent enzyme [Acidimicrobiia bacterium]
MVTRRLTAVVERMERAARRADRDPAEVTLVAVSKGQPPEAVLDAYRAGHRHFGENRAPELAAKAPLLPDDIIWHFIGTLQTRQAKIALPHTALLHSLDRPRLINTLAAAEYRPPSLLQVNVAGEQQKHGAAPGSAATLLDHAGAAGVSCVGLMTMPPLAGAPEDNRLWFRKLREMSDELAETYPGLGELSMGMTDDFEVAIEEGATIIRVGRAIFGPPGSSGTSD